MRGSLFTRVLHFLLLVVLWHTAECTRRPLNITWDQFSSGLTDNRFPAPSEEQYERFVNTLEYAGITEEREAAMFLAHLIHETGGFRFLGDVPPEDADDYKSPIDVPGQRYYARGYIQISWAATYLAASKAIYGDDRLLQNPDLVANDEDAAFLTAGWYWRTRVTVVPGVKEGRFGESTRAINGIMECNGEYLENSKNRFRYYKKVFKLFGAKGEPDERGCYN